MKRRVWSAVSLALFAAVPAAEGANVAPAQNNSATRALATQGALGLRPADPRALEAAIAQHLRAKAALPRDEAADLDALARALRGRVMGAVPSGGNLMDATTAIVSMNAPALSPAESRVLAGYVLNEIAAGGQAQLLNATRDMQETQMSFNLQYLQLQSQMQNENRSYTAVSNIIKTKHDTVKNSVGNIR